LRHATSPPPTTSTTAAVEVEEYRQVIHGGGPLGPKDARSARGDGTAAWMQPALARIGLLPPPAAGAMILTRLNGRVHGAQPMLG